MPLVYSTRHNNSLVHGFTHRVNQCHALKSTYICIEYINYFVVINGTYFDKHNQGCI